MKKTIGLAALMLTAVAAFAQPAAAYHQSNARNQASFVQPAASYERLNGRTEVKKEVVPARPDYNSRDRRDVRDVHDVRYARPVQSDRNCR